MGLMFIIGTLAVLVISFIAICCCFVMVGVVATVHRFMILPIMRARAPWRFLPDDAGPAETPDCRGIPDVTSYRLVLEAIATKLARLRELQDKMVTVGLDAAERRETGDLVCDLWFLAADRREYERDPEFMKLLTAPDRRFYA